MESKVNNPALSGIPLEELARILAPLPRYRAAQIIKWIAAGTVSFDEMDNLPLPVRAELARHYDPRPPVTVEKYSDEDATVKLALRFADGARVESVLLADRTGRRTACLSTQAGCPAGCVFCKTGTTFLRDLDSAEIIEQFLQLKTISNHIANIVVMGMGEPLLNWAELRRSLAVISCKEGFKFSRRRITVSTCGIVQGITALADDMPAVRLAISLTTGDEDLRRRLMPISESLGPLKEALRYFQNRGGGRITLEAVLLGGVNTRDEDAHGIARFAQGLDAAVNLIPWNPVKGLEFEGKALYRPTPEEVKSFTQKLESLGLKVTLRYRRGRGIAGACGQLGLHGD